MQRSFYSSAFRRAAENPARPGTRRAVSRHAFQGNIVSAGRFGNGAGKSRTARGARRAPGGDGPSFPPLARVTGERGENAVQKMNPIPASKPSKKGYTFFQAGSSPP